MKRFLSLFLALVVAVGICLSAPVTIDASAANVSADQAINWCKERLGKALDYDGIYGAQCVDLIKYYYKYLAGVNTYGNGEDYATNALPSGWTRTKAGVPQKGDVLVYVDDSVDANGNPRVGHVAIYESDYSTYHQNYNGKYVENITKYYKNACRSTAYYWGCIHPDFAGNNSSSVSYTTITNGLYYLKNNSSGTYIAVAEGKDANGQAVNLWNKSESFRLQITKDTNGYVMRFPGVSSTRVVNQYADNPVSGTKVTLYTYSGSKSQSWGFQKVSSGYVIRSMYNQNLCLTGNGSSVATVTTYTGASNQIWTLESYCTHSSTTTKNAKSATCTATGYTGDKYCSSCGALVSYGTTTAKLGHSTSVINKKSATCTATGYTGDTYCSRCKTTVSSGSTIAKLGHSTSIINEKSATCTATGYTGDTYCSRCKTTVSSGSTIAKLGHSTSIINKKSATCTATGYTGDTYCSTCKTTISKGSTIAKTAHKTTVVNAKSATCTATGYSGDTKCTVCGTVTAKGTTVSKIAHKTTVVNAKSATCTATGYTGDTKCTVCGTVTAKGTTIAKVAHKTTIVNAKDATIEVAGYTGDKYCSMCQTVVEKGKEIPKLGVSLTTPTVSIKNTAKGIQVNWNKIENAQSYIVYRREYNASTKKWGGWSKLKTGVTGTSYVDSTVKLGTQYRYTVRAVNGSVMSEYTSTATLKYNVTPTVKIANASTGIKVSWSTVANATGYTVYSSTYNAKTKKWSGWKNRGTTKATTTSWVDKSVKSGTCYKYTVRACNGKSIKSSYKGTSELLFLSQPTVKIANAATGVKVSWNKVTGATGYTVYRSEYKNGAWTGWSNRGTAKSDKTSWTDTKVTSGVQYKYTVRAVKGDYKSSYKASNTIKFTSTTTTNVVSISDLTFKLNADGKSYAITDCKESAKGTLTVPNTYNGKPVTRVEYFAFAYCSSITSVVFGDNLESLGGACFWQCEKLKKVTLPNKALDLEASIVSQEMGYYNQFSGTAIEQTAYNSGEAYFYIGNHLIAVFPQRLDGSIEIKEGTLSIPSFGISDSDWVYSIKKVKIPGSVKVIPENAFSGFAELKEVSLGYGVNEIGESAFENTGIYSIVIPGSIVKVNAAAFSECKKLNKVQISSGVKYIGGCAFYNCVVLKSVTIPASVENIGKYAFGIVDVEERLPGFTIYGATGSEAEDYADRSGLKFVVSN